MGTAVPSVPCRDRGLRLVLQGKGGKRAFKRTLPFPLKAEKHVVWGSM